MDFYNGYYFLPIHFALVRLGCGQNYHKRCVVKIPNNCNRSNNNSGNSSKRSSLLQPPRSPSGGSTQSLISNDEQQQQHAVNHESGSSLVKRMSDLMNDIIK